MRRLGLGTPGLVPRTLQEKLREDPLEGLLEFRLKQDRRRLRNLYRWWPATRCCRTATSSFNQADTYGWPYMEKLAAQEPGRKFRSYGPARCDHSPPTTGPRPTPTRLCSHQGGGRRPDRLRLTGGRLGHRVHARRREQRSRHPYAARLPGMGDLDPEAGERNRGDRSLGRDHRGSTDERKITSMPWYTRPKRCGRRAVDAELGGAERDAFYEEMESLFGPLPEASVPRPAAGCPPSDPERIHETARLQPCRRPWTAS